MNLPCTLTFSESRVAVSSASASSLFAAETAMNVAFVHGRY